MADNGVVLVDDKSKIVTKFLLDTFRLRQPSEHHLQAAATVYSELATVRPTVDEFCFIPLTTGSSAEFYIQPMLSCVGDVDIMYHQSNMLAIPEGYSPPTDLSAEFHSRVEVYEIIDSEFPGYVYLMSSY